MLHVCCACSLCMYSASTTLHELYCVVRVYGYMYMHACSCEAWTAPLTMRALMNNYNNTLCNEQIHDV